MTSDDDKSSGGTIYDGPLTSEEKLQEVWRRHKILVSEPAVWTEPGEGQPTRGWQGGRAPATSTFYEQAQLDDEDVGGRYAPARGNSPTAYPALPPTSPWAVDPAGLSPPLGECVDDLPDMTTVDGHSRDPDAIPWHYGTEVTEANDTGQEASAFGCPSSEIPLVSETAEGSQQQPFTASVEPSAVPLSQTHSPGADE